MGLLNGISTSISEIFSPIATLLYGSESQFLPLPPNVSEIGRFYDGTPGSRGGGVFFPLRNQIEVAMDPTLEGLQIVYDNIVYRPKTGPKPSSIKIPIPKTREISQIKSSLSSKLDFQIKANQARINTVLEERSYLDFLFPIGTGIPLRRRVCFFENPKISEDRSSRYSENQIVGRNEPSRRYVGSEARRIRLDFDYTLPHVEYFWSLMGRTAQMNMVSEDRSDGQRSLLKTDYAKYIKDIVSEYFGDFKSRISSNAATPEVIIPGIGKGPSLYRSDTGAPQNSPLIQNGIVSNSMAEKIDRWNIDEIESSLMMATYYTHFVIDTIRASVIGNFGENFGPFGPPIVKFRHGTLFTEAPFIVKNYSINFSERNGYEVKTLLPRTVSFSLSLEEFRQTSGKQHGNPEGDDDKVMSASDILSLDRIRGK